MDELKRLGFAQRGRALVAAAVLRCATAGLPAALALIVAAVCLFVPAMSVRAETLKAELTARPENGYARLILNFDGRSLLPQYDALITNNVLRISFQDRIDVKVDHVPLKLPTYVSIARQDPDGSAIRLALTQEYRINTMEAGEKLFIDLLPATWSGPTPPLPDSVVKELALRAEEALKRARALEQARLRGQVEPEVALRIGLHPTFTRLSFMWNLPFDTAFVREGDIVKLTFNHQADLDLSQLRAHLPPGIADATSFVDEGKLKFLLRLSPDVDIRAFREADAYVVDVTPERREADPVNEAVRRALDSGLPEGASEVISAPGRSNSGAPEDTVAAPGGSPLPLASDRTAAPESEVVPPTDKAEAPQEKAGDLTASPPPSRPEQALPPAIDLGSVDPKPLKPELAEEAAPPGPESAPAGYEAEARRFVAAEARRIGNTIRIVFPFAEPVSSAVFRRNQSVWLVFDTPDPIDVRGMRSVLAKDADAVEVATNSDWQSIRVDLAENALATVGNDGNTWVMTIGDSILEPSRPLSLGRNVRSDGGTILHVPLQEPQNLRLVKDPFVGDVISVVTAFGPARGLLKPQTFAELEALMSAHGLAVLSRIDDLQIRLEGDAVLLQGPRGLFLSNDTLKHGSRILDTIVDPAQPGQVDLGSLMTSNTTDFLNKAKNFQLRIAATPEGQRRRPRMDLARFYLAHGLAQEALGLMQLAAEDDPAIERDSSFNLMTGAAQVLARRPKIALKHLNRHELRNSPDAAVWQTIAAADLRDWPSAREAIARGRAVIGNYPLSIQNDFSLSGAQVMVEVNDFGQAARILSEVDPSTLSGDQAARYDLLRGRIADASGRSREALTSFELVRRSQDGPRAAEAAYRALRIRYRDGDIDIDSAIRELGGLAAGWRGDETELRTLRFLAQLHVRKGEYRTAFEAMKAAVVANPDSETTRLAQEEMNAVFATLFLDGKADELDPIQALALFYDFRELTPVGRRGDEMVRRLASRLVAVDLLDQASELLKHQVDNRLKGAARAQIAADLGVVYLMDRKPDEALRVLNRTRQAQLPRSLSRQRNIVEARALTESGRPDLALELVRNMNGEDVERLRADTLWAAGNWQRAGEQLEQMAGGRWGDGVPLSDRERADILKAAIAYSLAGDQFSLDRLRTKFTAKMADSPDAKAFEVVSRSVDERGVEFFAVLDNLGRIDSLDIFLAEYQRNYLRQSSQPLWTDDTDPDAAGDSADTDLPPAASVASASVPKG